MKIIKDYLHLYLGCEISIAGRYNVTLTVSHTGTSCIDLGSVLLNPEFKPILRPLSSMTEDEAKEMTQVMYDSIYGSGTLFIDSNYCDEDAPDKAGFVFKDETDDRIGVTFEERGIEFSANGTKLIIPQFEIVKMLLGKNFDLFGLIGDGLAIDATTLNPAA